jgi:hypothetical protein
VLHTKQNFTTCTATIKCVRKCLQLQYRLHISAVVLQHITALLLLLLLRVTAPLLLLLLLPLCILLLLLAAAV